MAWHPFRNLGLKVAALALGTLLWLTVSGQHAIERIMRVPLDYRNVPATIEITGDPPASVEVRLRGTSGQFNQLAPNDVRVFVDLSATKAGTREFVLGSDQVVVPFGIEVIRVDPQSIRLSVERSDTKTVPVEPAVDGQPAPGFVVGRISVTPPSVAVVGPESRVRDVVSVSTHRVSVEGATAPVTELVGVTVGEGGVRLRDPRPVQVTVAVMPGPIERTYGERPVALRGLAGGRRATVTPARVAVTVRGDRTRVVGLDEADIVPFVDLAGLGPGRYRLSVSVDARDGVALLSVDPAAVMVEIR